MITFPNCVKKLAEKLWISKSNTIYKSFEKTYTYNSQVSYVPFGWLYHSCGNNSKINRLRKCCLKIIYSDKHSSYVAFLEKYGSISIHNRNLQILTTEMYKVSKGLSPPVITELFKHRDEQHYCLKNNVEFTIPVIRTIYHRSESISSLGPRIWNALPDR